MSGVPTSNNIRYNSLLIFFFFFWFRLFLLVSDIGGSAWDRKLIGGLVRGTSLDDVVVSCTLFWPAS